MREKGKSTAIMRLPHLSRMASRMGLPTQLSWMPIAFLFNLRMLLHVCRLLVMVSSTSMQCCLNKRAASV